MSNLKHTVGDKIRIAEKTHIGAWPYRGKKGVIVGTLPEAPGGYFVVLEGKSERLFFLDWEVEGQP